MTKAMALLRLYRLDPARRRVAIRAAATLAAASVVLALFPFRRAIAFGNVPLGTPSTTSAAQWVSAIAAAARRLPLRTMCIEQGLATQRLLRRDGFDARLHYGARHHPQTGKLEAHVWVTVGGDPVIGGKEAVDFHEIAIFP